MKLYLKYRNSECFQKFILINTGYFLLLSFFFNVLTTSLVYLFIIKHLHIRKCICLIVHTLIISYSTEH